MSGSVPEPSCILAVRATPRAKSNRLELVDDVAKVWVTAAPADGQANEALRKMIAERLGIAPSRVNLVRGATARDKSFRIDGLTLESVRSRL